MDKKQKNEVSTVWGTDITQTILEYKHGIAELNKELDKSEPSLISSAEQKRKEERKKELLKKWEIEEARQNKVLEDFHKKCVEADLKGVYVTGSTCGNMVGDRIKRIMHNLHISIMELSDATGVSRSSLQRYLRAEDPDVPKAHTLKKILSNKLFVFGVDLFTRYPDDYKRWEEEYDGGLPVELDGVAKPFTNYEQLKGYLIDQLRNPMSFLIAKEIPTQTVVDEETKKAKTKYDIKEVPMPDEIAQIFATHLLNVFETVELLLEPEKQKTPSVVISYRSHDEEVDIEEFPG